MISSAYYFIFVLIVAFPAAQSAPTSIDANTLLQNGQAAQQLNAEFQSLKITDSCNTGDTACISKLPAQCTNGVWHTQQCGGTKQCFALPSVTANGTFIACTSEANALSLIAATGAQGGLTSNTTSNGIDPPGNPDSSSFSTTTATATTTTTTSGSAIATVTQIIALPTTFPATTFTLQRAEASALISSLDNAGAFQSPSVVSTSTSSSSTASTTPGFGGELSPSLSIPSIIQLTGSFPSATPSTSVTSSSSASSTPAGASSVGSGY